ncbi:hypothetical protein MAUB1S_11413 [Mycolicibacterium aubagnense]
MTKPVFSYAINSALRAAAKNPIRSDGGYGEFPNDFVALKTAKRLVDMGFATVPRVGIKGTSLELTEEGRAALAKVQP